MNTLTRQILAYLSVLLAFPLAPLAMAGETNSPAPSQTDTAAPSAPPAATPPAPTDQPAPQLLLPRGYAIAMAVYRNIDLRIEALNFKMAETDAAKSWGIYNPVFNASGSAGVTAVPGDPFFSARTRNASVGLTQSLPTGGSIGATTQTGFFSVDTNGPDSKDWQSTAGLTLTQPLLKNAGRETMELNITLAANTQQDSLERFRSTTIDTVSNVITAYNHLYVLRQTQETRVAALNSAQRLFDDIRKRASIGAVQGMDLANAEFAIAQRRKDLVEASRNVKDQEVNLRYLIGLDLPTQIIPSDPPSRFEPQETDEQAAKAALEHRGDLKQLQVSLQSTELQERVARRQSWPDLSANATGGLTGTGTTFGQSYDQIAKHPGTYWTAGMQFSVPLGNTTAGNEYKKAKIRTEQVRQQIRALSWKIRNDVESDMRALISARLQMQLSDRSSQLAEQRLEEYRKNNQLGSATIQDVLNAENDRNTAHTAQLEAIETFSNAVTKLWKDTGLLLDRQGVHIDTSHPDKLTESKEQNPSLLVDPPPPLSPPETTAPGGNQTTVTPVAAPPSAPVAAPAASSQAPAAHVRYAITIGEFPTKSAMADAIRRIRRAGLAAHIKQGPAKIETMIRLHVADYPNQKTALQEVGRLARIKADGFVINERPGDFSVYAGSYRDRKQAVIEQERLAALGVKTVFKDVSISRSTFLLTAGSFATREAAAEKVKVLEKRGLKSTISEGAD